MPVKAIKKNIGKCRHALVGVPILGAILAPAPKVAVIRLAGVIADATVKKQGISYSRCERMIEDAFDVYNLKAVALLINSPGGSPAQSELIANLVRALAEEKEIQVYTFVEDVAASGGYWLACAGDKIYAAETSITGSIGVISASFGFQELIGKYGVERRIHTSGKDKSFLDPFVSEKPADVKRLSDIQRGLHENFIDWVKERRSEKLQGSDKELFEGAFWTSEKALELGLIDATGDYKTVCKDLFGEDIKFAYFSPDKGIFSALMGTDMKAANMSEEILNLIEDRSLWARFGL